MVLEATIICVDNSEYMRNGDYFPTRLEAQTDAVNLVMGWKYSANAENVVGILTMSKSPEVLVTPSPEIGKILTALHHLKIQGEIDLLSSIQVAQLALKHRQNKNQRQRMILFVGSPLLHVDGKALTRLGANLKKNNVAVDVVCFGDIEVNAAKLTDFVNAVDSSNNSHMVTVEPGRALTEALRSSLLREGGGGGGGGDAVGGDFDASEDPELAMAIQASLAEARQQAGPTTGAAPGGKTGTPSVPDVAMGEGMLDDGMDEDMRLAIQLSMQVAGLAPMDTQPTSPPSTEPFQATQTEDKSAHQTNEPAGSAQHPTAQHQPTSTTETKPPTAAETPSAAKTPTTSAKPSEEDFGAVINNPHAVQEILKELPGVDLSDPSIKSLLEGLGQTQETSTQTQQPAAGAGAGAGGTKSSSISSAQQGGSEDMDEDLELALALSMQTKEQDEKKEQQKKTGQ